MKKFSARNDKAEPDEVVAIGAAVKPACSGRLKDWSVGDTPLSLGVETWAAC